MENSSKKSQKKSRNEFLIALALLLALIAAVIVIVFVLPKLNKTPAKDRQNAAAPEMPFEVPGFTMLDELDGIRFDNGLQVLCAGTYSGAYLEDGSDEQVKDVLTVVVKNTGSSLVEYGVIELPYGRKTAIFEFSGLPVGSAVLVQEKNRLTWSKGQKCKEFSCTECALPGSIVLDFGSDFELYPSDGVMNVKNISGADISGDVSVFYKNFEYGLFMGGITYRARISGGIAAGQIGQSMQKHYYDDTSAILYMAYEK